MTAPSGPGPGQPDPGLAAIISERRQLINLAYRLLGSLAEAEDAVQETYARWYALTACQRDAIASPGAWLTTVTSRICLGQLGSARARRERYVGQWIPEPLPEPAEWISSRPAAPADLAAGAPALTILERTVNGQPGLIAQHNGTTVTVFAFDITGDHITRIWAIRNPDKLRPWTTGGLPDGGRPRLLAVRAKAGHGEPVGVDDEAVPGPGTADQGPEHVVGDLGHRPALLADQVPVGG